MVRRAFMKHASLYIFGGILLIGIALAALNYRSLFGDKSTSSRSAAAEQVAPAPKPKPLTAESLLFYTNEARKDAKLNALTLNEHLTASATAKVEDMVANKYYGHENPTTKRPGYSYIYEKMPDVCKFVGENLYEFEQTPTDKTVDYAKKAVDTWVAEEKQEKTALFDPEYTLVGYGIKDKYVVQHFCQLKASE